MMAVKHVWLVALLAVSMMVSESAAANILGLFPFPAKSHMISFSALMKELARRGHQITVVSSWPMNPPVPNYTDIIVPNPFDSMEHTDWFTMEGMNGWTTNLAMWELGSIITEAVLSDPGVQKLIRSKESKFDLIVIENFFDEAFLGFVDKYKVPFISMSTFGGFQCLFDSVGNPTPYSYVPDPLLSYGDHMTFTERLENTLIGVFQGLGRALYFIPRQEALMRKYFHDSDSSMPSISELEDRTNMVFINTHVSLSYPRPFLPNVIPVGGLHISKPKKLPQDLQKFLDDAPHGVIYFSMGSNLRSANLPQEKRDAILKTFAGLKQKVLWKWEEDTLPGKPANVKLGKWLPQNDILAHPNVVLFITHGGLLSTQEAIYHGMPLVGIPIFGDQVLNMMKAESAGYGILLEFQNITTKSLSWAVNSVVKNPVYRQKAQLLSSVFRDQPSSPMEQAVFWTEYLLRHNGAPHFRSAAKDLFWFQYYLLDVLAVIALAAGTVVTIVGLVIYGLITLCCRKKKHGPAQSAPNKKKQ